MRDAANAQTLANSALFFRYLKEKFLWKIPQEPMTFNASSGLTLLTLVSLLRR
jgi:hypothetical protein